MMLDPRALGQQQQPGLLAQYNGMAPGAQAQPAFNPNTLLALGAGIAGGKDWGEGLSRGFSGALQVRQADQQRQEKYGTRNQTFQTLLSQGVDPRRAWLLANSPEVANALSADDQRKQAQSNSDRSFGLQQQQLEMQRQIAEQGRTPAGFQRTPEGGMAPVPGGPGDPAYIQQTQALRGNIGLSPAEKAVDTEFGKDYAEFVAGGGYTDAKKNIEQLKGVLGQLKAGEGLTGPAWAILPSKAMTLLNPQGMQAKETVEEVAQRNLRLILGGQFAMKEGEQLISRAYNPGLPPAENAKRLERLLTAMDAALEEKARAATHYEQYGTLRGYKGAGRISIRDLERAMDGPQQRTTRAPMDNPAQKDQSRLGPGSYVYDPATNKLVPAK